MSIESISESASRYSKQEWATRVELAALYRISDIYGMTDITNQAISARVEGEPEHFLIRPRDLMYGEVLASDFVKVDLNGKGSSGDAIPNFPEV